MIENNRTVEYLKSIKKYRPIPLPKTGQPRNSRDDINLIIYSNYKQYHDEVCKMSAKKRKVTFEDEATVERLCVRARGRSPYPWTGVLAHGCRNGVFLNYIAQSLGVTVDGTELSPAASQSNKKLVKGGWDFHEIKPEWQERYDMIWSSSFCHAYDPYKAIQQWMKCVKRGPTGCAVVLHHAPGSDAKQVERDIPFGANLDETILLINAAGRDKRNGGRNFHVETVWNKSDGVSWERSKFKRYIVVVPTR